MVTVVSKELIPPRGDKHDYIRMGRYGWLDPTKREGLPHIRKAGQFNSEVEKLDRYPLSNFAIGVLQ